MRILFISLPILMIAACSPSSEFQKDHSGDRNLKIDSTVDFKIGQARIVAPVVETGRKQVKTPDIDLMTAYRLSNRALFTIPGFPRRVQLPRRVTSWVRDVRLRLLTARCYFIEETRGYPSPVAYRCVIRK